MPGPRKEINYDLARNVMNQLRLLSKGKQAISCNELADTILTQRISNPSQGIVTAMRKEVFAIVKTYFPGVKPHTRITLGDNNGAPPSNARTKVKVFVDRDALINDLLAFIGDAEFPPELLKRIEGYKNQ